MAFSLMACGGNESTELVVIDPCCEETGTCLKQLSESTEVSVFEGGCPDDARLEAGDTTGALFQETGSARGVLPEIRTLSAKPHGFAVLYRDTGCRVVGYGCVDANPDSVKAIRIEVRAWSRAALCTPLQTGSCGGGNQCTQGVCGPTP